MSAVLARRGVLGLGAAQLLAMAAPRRARAADPATLIFGLGNYPPTLRAFAQAGNSGNAVKLLLHRGLMSYDAAGALRPELATGWTQPNDHEFIFDLREAHFHNGDPVTADDVVYSLNEIRKPDSTAFMKSSFAVIDQVEALAPRRVRIVLNRPCATLLDLLAQTPAPVISAKSAGLQVEEPIGCGPYAIAVRARGEHILLKRVSDYYKPGLPKFAAVDFVAYSDETLRQAALEAGDADLIESVPWQSIVPLQKNPAVTVQTGMGGYFYLKFNFNSERFGNPKVRQAIGFAVDRQAVTDVAFFGQGAPMYGLPIPNGPLFPDAEVGQPFSHDPKRAKQLLAEAGYPNGFSASIVTLNDPGTFQRAAQVVQQNLAAIGIQLDIVLLDYATLTSKGDKGLYEFSVYGATGFFNDPDGVSVMLSGPPNYLRSFGFKSPRVEKLLLDGRSSLDPARRKAIYLELQQACFEETPLIGLSWRAQAYAMKTSIKGFDKMPYFLNAYSPIELESTWRA
jgi:peptide/nickel transport system substrate-binding protein